MSVKTIAAKLLARIFCILPIQKNKVVFCSFHGKNCSDAPKTIAEKLREYGHVKEVWILNNPIDSPNGSAVKPFTIRELFELETAAVWVDNAHKYPYMLKRKGQLYIQTWHGSVGLKKVEAGAQEVLGRAYVERAKRDASITDLMIADNEWQYKEMKTVYWYSGEVAKCRVRHVNKTVKEIDDLKQRISELFGTDSNTHFLLYAPTFRESGDVGPYNLNYAQVVDALEKKFGGKWAVIVRLHPNIFEYQKQIQYNDRILNGSLVEDIGDLTYISDIVVSDYSSSIFYGMRMKKITFIYAEDWKEYNRDFEFDLHELPAIFTASNEEFIQAIAKFDSNEYYRKLDGFLSEIGFYEEPGPEYIAEIIHNHITMRNRYIDDQKE